LLALTRGLAKALAPAVQVNAIAPGVVLLPEGTTDEERRQAIERVPLDAWALPRMSCAQCSTWSRAIS